MRLIPKIGASKSKSTRRAPANRRRRRLIVAGACVVGVAAVTAGAWQLSANGWIDARMNALGASVLDVSADAGLRVDDVVLSGRHNADAAEILAALDIERGSPIFAIDMKAARNRIESLGWVRSAEIARRLPDVVFVRVVERQPLAIWQHDGQAALVDRFGKTIQQSGLDAFAHLPLAEAALGGVAIRDGPRELECYKPYAKLMDERPAGYTFRPAGGAKTLELRKGEVRLA